LTAKARRVGALQHAQDTVTGSGGGQVLQGVTTYDAPRREDWCVEGLQDLCEGIETNHNRQIGSSCVSLRQNGTLTTAR